MMKKMHWLTLALGFALLTSILFTSFAAARPQAFTYVVDSSAGDADNSPGDGYCSTASGECTLYAAIQEANADGDTSTITFSQKFQSPDSIAGCSLPAITDDGTTIDASSQWDTTYGRPGVEIIDLGCTLLTINADNTSILGLLFSGGSTIGVKIYGGSFNGIGGFHDGQRNVFLTDVVGVYQLGGTYTNISNNYFGTIDGDTLPGGGMGQVGIELDGGDWTTISNNLIVGQSDNGIFIKTNNNYLTDNLIGVSSNQNTALPNKIGITIGWGSDNDIGPGNVIAGNTSHGIRIDHADNNTVYGNNIGLYLSGVGNGGDGINLFVSDNIQVTGGNVIAYNDGSGIYAEAAISITVQGNTVYSNNLVGIYFKDITTGQIGGSGSDKLNSVCGNQGHGIQLDKSSAINVMGNYIGLSQGAFEAGNLGYGILIHNGSTGNYIGGGSGEANYIGFNHLDGIELDGSDTYNNYIMGNVIGAAYNYKWAAPNFNHGVGVYNGAHDNWIGWGGLPNEGNIILASGWSGVAIVGSNNNVVWANHIGTNGSSTHWGNAFYGVSVSGSGNTLMENEIAYNGTDGGEDNAQAGVLVDGAGSTDNRITDNSIHDNDGPGIKLANNANHNLAAPVLTSANCSQVQGTACANCWIEFYSDSEDEGRVYEGHFTTPASGVFTWNGAPTGPNITALAIGPGSAGDTSPFSSPFHVGICHALWFYLPTVTK
jgi:parallel beta-helix repeat protein